MTVFWPGQPVRHRAGDEGFFRAYRPRVARFGWDCAVQFKNAWVSKTGHVNPPSFTAFCHSDDLTPLLPPGMESVEVAVELVAPELGVSA